MSCSSFCLRNFQSENDSFSNSFCFQLWFIFQINGARDLQIQNWFLVGFSSFLPRARQATQRQSRPLLFKITLASHSTTYACKTPEVNGVGTLFEACLSSSLMQRTTAIYALKKAKKNEFIFRQRHFGVVQVRNELNRYMFYGQVQRVRETLKYDGWPGPKLCQSSEMMILLLSSPLLFFRVIFSP